MNVFKKAKDCKCFIRDKNVDTRSEFNIEGLNSRTDKYTAKWRGHVNRMPERELRNQVKKCKPNGKV